MPVHYAVQYKPRRRWLTYEEAMKLLDNLEAERAAHVAFMLGSGARLSESLRATPDDRDGETLRVHGSKTRESDGTIVITPLVRPFLDYAWEHAPRRKDRLFRPWLKIHRDLKAACARAGIPACTPNDLRRTFATWHHQAGVAPWMIGKLLRHGLHDGRARLRDGHSGVPRGGAFDCTRVVPRGSRIRV